MACRWIALLVLALMLPAWGEEPVALVVDAQGGPAILRELYAQETLTLEEGARATLVFYGDGHQEKLTGPGRFTIAAQGAAGPKVQSLARPGPGKFYPLGENAARGTGASVRGAPFEVRGEPVVFQVETSRRLTVTWETRQEGPYQLELTGRKGLLWKTQTGEKRAVVERPLEVDQRYTLELRPAEGEDPINPFRFPFRLPSEETRRLLEQARLDAAAAGKDPVPHVILMQLAWERDDVVEAAGAGLEALKLRPDNDSLEWSVKELVFTSGRPEQVVAFYVDRITHRLDRKNEAAALELTNEVDLEELARRAGDPELQERLEKALGRLRR